MGLLFKSKLKNKTLHLPAKKMNQHFLLMGDSGVGKTMANRQFLYEAQERGDAAVVLDSKNGEYIEEFYSEKRGDVILNPMDVRCPYWKIYEEFDDEPSCLTVSRSMYPAHPNNPQAQFWDDYASRLSSFIQSTSKSFGQPLDCTDLARIITSEKQIMEKVKGNNEYSQLFSSTGSSPMRTSVIQTMSTLGYALRMMPKKDETSRTFSMREWAQNPQGWLFMSNNAASREAVRPLQGAWVSLAVLFLMTEDQGAKRVWIDLDELDSLNTIAALPEGMTMIRSKGHIFVLGMQNVGQLEDRYGKQADIIFSQAGTKLLFALSDDKSAKRGSDVIGEVEYRQIRQSRTTGIFGGRERDSYSGPEEVRKPLVIPSEISGLPDLHAYFLQRPTDDEVGLHVVKIKVPVFPGRTFSPGLIPRIMPAYEVGYETIDLPPDAISDGSESPDEDSPRTF